MKRKELLRELAQRLELPEEALGEGRITVTAGRRALLEDHRGILEYAQEQITVGLGRGKVRILGTGLYLEAMDRRTLLICGEIRQVEWEG